MIKEIYSTDRELFLEVLKNREVKKEEIPFLYNLLANSNDDKIVFHIYRFLDENPEFIDYELLSKITGINKETLNQIFTKKPVKAFFPIGNAERGEIATAYIFKLRSKAEKNSFTDKRELKNIKKVLESRDILIEDFFVIFDKNFVGSSYLLSVLAGLVLEEEILSDFSFTGEVNSEGEILQVDYIEQKKKACKESGLKLITPMEVSNIDELVFFLNTKEIDIPFLVLNKSEEEIERSMRKVENKIKDRKDIYSLEKILKIYGLEKQDLYVETGFVPAEEKVWKDLIKEVERKLKKIYSSLKHKKITLHIATSIASLSFGLGVLIGIKRSYVLYHFQNEDYFPVLDLTNPDSLRSLKEIKKDILKNQEFINLEIKIEGKPEKVNFILYLASHNPVGDVLIFTKNNSYVYISDKNFQGNIPLKEELWKGYLSEIYSVINEFKTRYLITKFNLFISCPSVMALALGMILGHYFDINVYNYYRNLSEKYFKVFNTTEIETVF